MKRILTLLIAAICTVGLWAEEFAIGELTFRTTSDTEVELDDAKNDITSAYFGATITYQGKTYCLTSIGDEAFHYCYSLTSITIPNSVTNIGNKAFYRCSSLTSITIPNSVTSIGDEAFEGCYGLTSITIPNSVTSIGEEAFAGCSRLTSITIPNSVTSIGNKAFVGCSGLTSITIPNSVTSIGHGAFAGCSSLKSIIVQNGNPIYDNRENCNAIIETATNTLIAGCQNTIIPNSVTSIGDEAFEGCSGLTSVTIPNSVTSIGNGAFYNCSGLTSITIPNSVTSIGANTFDNTAILKNPTNWNNGALYINNCLISVVKNWIGDYNVKENTRLIAGTAFSDCKGLTSITIPNSVTSIGDRAFYDCDGLASITIPNSVTSIGIFAFYRCSSLTSVTIPESVTSIGIFAFEGTAIYENKSNWENGALYIDNCLIDISDGVAGDYSLKKGTRLIANEVFSNCSSLTSITIPESVTSIGKEAFEGCESLKSVIVPNHTEIGAYAFPSHTQIIRK